MSASPDQLVTLLFDGALSALVRSRLFFYSMAILQVRENLSPKPLTLLKNGLKKKGWMKNSGDSLADNLTSLYRYMVHRLLQANLHNDSEAIQEVETLLRNIADAWKEVSGTTALQDAV
ncbi:flagellar export chaperone FliS [Erwinia tracheiphila]